MPLDSLKSQPDQQLIEQFRRSRENSLRLASAFSKEDWMIQSMEEASPIKWNLAHTSWFYETFVLKPFVSGYRTFDPAFNYLFNSYYQQVGEMHPRPIRGVLSRPSADEIVAYRAHVDAAVISLLETADVDAIKKLRPLIEMGCAHEEQHQELLLTDIKHGLSMNPVSPCVFEDDAQIEPKAPALDWIAFEGGLVEIGTDGAGFSFDNEGPQHKTYLAPFELANRPVTNGEFMAFMEAGGYRESSIWLADGWDMVQRHQWRAPLYWRQTDKGWRHYTLSGVCPINPAAPVMHLSYYEAAAFAEWTSFRLPTEFEWEHASQESAISGCFVDNGAYCLPTPASGEGLQQMFGSVWEWTASPYVAYPGYRAQAGAIGEYNGKFMSSQMVLRGGSCATPSGHVRRTYRNFFPPNARWQFSGLRLARDV